MGEKSKLEPDDETWEVREAAAAEALRSASDDLKKEIATEAEQTLSAKAKRDAASVLGAAAPTDNREKVTKP